MLVIDNILVLNFNIHIIYFNNYLMKKNVLLLSFIFIVAPFLMATNLTVNDTVLNSNNATRIINSTQADPWVTVSSTLYQMTIYAKVKKNGTLYQPTGLLIGGFKNNVANQCWGYKGLTSGPAGLFFNLSVAYNSTPVTGFNFKVYDATNGKTYDCEETYTFTANTPIGKINIPIFVNLKFAISRISGNATMGSVSGTANGSFTSGQSVNVIATPLSGYRFVNWTDGVGGAVMSTNADYTFSANETRNLIANFEILPVVTVTSNINSSSIPSANITDVIVSTDGVLVIDAPVTFKSLTIQNGGKVIIPTTKSLIVTGDFLLKSNPATVTSTLTDLNANGGFTVNGTTTVEQYLTGAGGATPNGRYWYIGTPVAGATSAVFDAAGANQLWYYSESAHTYVEITDNATPLIVGKGYVVRLGANTTVNFIGTLVTGNMTTDLTNNSGNEKSGYNLIVNPYLSFVNINSVLTGIGSNSVWTRSVNTGDNMVFDTYNYKLKTGTSGSGNSVTSFIAPMQAFWVKLNSAATGSIVLNNTIRSLKDSTDVTNKLRVPEQVNSAQKLLRLKVSNGINSDEAVIAFNANAMDSFDEYDSPKMSNNNVSIPEIYTIADGTKLAINGLNAIVLDQQLDLGFNTGQSNTFSIKATDVSNFDEDVKIILQDNLLNKEIELVTGTEYSFTSNVVTSNSRFGIIFKSTSTVTDLYNKDVDQIVNVSNYINGKISVTLSNSNDNKATVILLNGLGQKLETLYSFDNSVVINKHLKSGIYFVNVNVSGVNTTKKLIVE